MDLRRLCVERAAAFLGGLILSKETTIKKAPEEMVLVWVYRAGIPGFTSERGERVRSMEVEKYGLLPRSKAEALHDDGIQMDERTAAIDLRYAEKRAYKRRDMSAEA